MYPDTTFTGYFDNTSNIVDNTELRGTGCCHDREDRVRYSGTGKVQRLCQGSAGEPSVGVRRDNQDVDAHNPGGGLDRGMCLGTADDAPSYGPGVGTCRPVPGLLRRVSGRDQRGKVTNRPPLDEDTARLERETGQLGQPA